MRACVPVYTFYIARAQRGGPRHQCRSGVRVHSGCGGCTHACAPAQVLSLSSCLFRSCFLALSLASTEPNTHQRSRVKSRRDPEHINASQTRRQPPQHSPSLHTLLEYRPLLSIRHLRSAYLFFLSAAEQTSGDGRASSPPSTLKNLETLIKFLQNTVYV